MATTATAGHSAHYWQRETQRHQEEILRNKRDSEIDHLRHQEKHEEEQLRHWYEQSQAALKSEYENARRYLHGRAWSQYVRDYHASRAELSREYSRQRRLLDERFDASQRETRDHHRQLERSLEHGAYHLDHGPASTVGHLRPLESYHGRPILRGQGAQPPIVYLPAPATPQPARRPAIRLEFPRFGLAIH